MLKKNIDNLSVEEKLKSVINDYNDIAREYTEEFYNDTSDNKYIDKFLKSLNGKGILDAGCGAGRDCKYVSKKGFDAIGIDISEQMIKIAKEKLPKDKFEIMDMTNISYPDNTFDGIISNCSLFHIPTEILPQTLKEFKRVLKPDGKLMLILQEGNGEVMIEEPYRQGTYIYMNYFSTESISKILEEHNFSVDEFEREEELSEFAPGSKKLIVFSSNKKEDKDVKEKENE